MGNTTTSVATLTVQYAPSITAQPADTTVGVGGTASFTASAAANPASTVQWQVSTDNGLTWTDIAGATSGTYSFTASSADDGKVYQAVFTNLLGTQYTTEATLTVQAAPTVSIDPVDTSVPVGATATFTAAASGDPVPTVQWQVKASGASTWSDIAGATDTTYSFNTSLSDDGAQYQAVFTNSVGTVTTAAATLSLAYAPSVTAQPASTTVNAGQTASFTAAATGSPAPTVQWYSSTDNGATWNPINGATSATYSFTASPGDDGSIFQAVFTNSQGNQVTQDAWLTVNYAPIISAQPSDTTVAVDGLASFTVTASSNPVPTVQWYSSTDSGVTWNLIGGATDTTYSVAASASDNGTQYQAVLTNAAGSTTSGAATLSVQVAPSITTQPVSAAMIAGQTATFTAAATGTPTPTVQWYSSTDEGATWNAIAGATSPTYSFTVADVDSGNLYHAVFTNSVASQATDEATLTVNTGLVITTQPTDQVVQVGYEAIFTAAATGTPEPTVQWYSSTDAGSTWNLIPDATDTTLSFAPGATDNGTQYQAVFTSALGTVTTTAATLTVQYAPSVTSDPASTTVNAGATASFTATANANPAAMVQWQVSTDDGLSWTDISGATSATYSLTTSSSNDGNLYQAVFTNAVGSVATQSAELTVQYITVTGQPVSQTVNAGQTATFTATATGTPTPTVQWQKSSNAGSTWSDISGATSATYTTPAVAGIDDGTQYRAVFTNNSGSVATAAATLGVQNYAPIVTGNPTATTVNAGATATFTAAGIGNPAPTVQWQISTNGGSSWSNISGATSTSYTTGVLTAADGGMQYRAVFINSLGSAATSTATLKVNQAPTITGQPASVISNSGTTATFTASATGTPTPTVQWQVSTNGTNWSDISGATSTSYSVVATGNSGSQYRAVFTNTVGTVTSSTATLTIAAVAQVSSTSIGWGTQAANLVDAGNGRLLPVARVNTIPWLGVNKITLTLNNPIASLSAGDISFQSAAGLSYSVQSISGSGTSWTINLANGGIVNPDKLTVTVANSSLATFSKRLDVLPGDVNDDGLVSSLDQLLVSRQLTGAYIAFYDVDGSGSLSADDVNKIKTRIGNRLPA